jgi:UDP-N-acetylglucosamine acyltransferase
VSIHPTALVHPGAHIPASCQVGPYSIVGPEVVLGEECVLRSHVVLEGRLHAGPRNRFHPFAAIGVAPQDLKYKDEPTGVELGADNDIRESVSISRGTPGGGGTTRVGSGCLIMAYAHIGHDSVVGDGCMIGNSAQLAGHVLVEDYAVIGALCPVHQFTRIGRYSYVGGGTTITQDVLPYSLTSARRETHAFGMNKVGLRRRGFAAERLGALHTAFRVLTAGKLNTSQAIERLREMFGESEDIAYLIDFIEHSKRSIHK